MKKRLGRFGVVLLGIIFVHLFCEMVFFIPKSDVLSQLDSAQETKGSIVGINWKTNEIREYNRALLLNRYRLSYVYQISEDSYWSANDNWYDCYAYEVVLPSGDITLHSVKPTWEGHKYIFKLCAVMIGSIYLYEVRNRKTEKDKESVL